MKAQHTAIKRKPEAAFRFLYLLFFALYLSGCERPDLTVPLPNEHLRTAGDFIRNNYEFKLFYEALVYTDLFEELNGKGPFTVLALKDGAFKELGINSRQDIEKLDRDSLRQVLAYHILPLRLSTADMPTDAIDEHYMTLAGYEVLLHAVHNPVDHSTFQAGYFDGCEILDKDISLANGIFHVLNKPMKYYHGKTVQDLLASRREYSLFVNGLKKFGLWQELSQDGPFTVFAPTNEALTSAGIDQAVLDTLTPAGYIGERLFGAYIMYNRHFFLTDYSLYKGTGYYPYLVRNDNTTVLWYSFADPYNFPESTRIYNLSLSGGLSSTQNVNPSKTDERCENGVVHLLKDALSTVEQCKKNK